MRQAISNAAFVEVVFGSYFLMRLAVPMKSPSEVIFDHAIGLSLALRSLQEFPSSLSLYEWLWLEQKCLSTLNHLRYCILRRHSSPSPESAFTPQIQRKVASICSLYSDLLVPINVFMQISERPQIYLKRLRLHQGCFFLFSFHLLQINHPSANGGGDATIACTLKLILQQFLDLILASNIRLRNDVQTLLQQNLSDFAQPITPSPLDISEYSRYFFLMLINTALPFPPSEENNTLAIMSAAFLCRICASRSDKTIFQVRDLFLAGLILTSSRHPVGIFPLRLHCLYFKPTHGSRCVFETSSPLIFVNCTVRVAHVLFLCYSLSSTKLMDVLQFEAFGLSNVEIVVFGSACYVLVSLPPLVDEMAGNKL